MTRTHRPHSKQDVCSGHAATGTRPDSHQGVTAVDHQLCGSRDHANNDPPQADPRIITWRLGPMSDR